MKRAGILFLTFLYAIAVIGISLSVHYCGQRLDCVTLGTKTKKCCCEKKEESKDCCTTKIITAKVTDTHQPGSQLKIAAPHGVKIFCYNFLGPLFLAQQKKIPVPAFYKNWHPPTGSPLFLLNRNILI